MRYRSLPSATLATALGTAITGIHAGDRASGDDLLVQLLQLQPLLRRVLGRYARQPQDLSDLLQDVYLKLLGWLQTPQERPRSVEAFSVHVARNVALDWLRKLESSLVDYSAEPEVLEAIDREADTACIVGAYQELERFAEIVSALPPQRRRVFTLRKVYGFSQKEIASHLGISENTVEQHLMKAARVVAAAAVELSVQPPWGPAAKRIAAAASN